MALRTDAFRASRAVPASLVLLLALTAACSGGGSPSGGPPSGGDAASGPRMAELAWAGPLAQIAVGASHACGLRTGGTIVCWGAMYGGWPGDGGWERVTSGRGYSCALHGDGSLACWGDAGHGKNEPPPGRFVDVDAGKQHACALAADGSAACWGWDAGGRATPPADTSFAAIAAGGAHSCGLTLGGDLLCWGQGGDKSQARGGPFRALDLGEYHTCALRDDGTAFCQGTDVAGETGPPGRAFAAIAAGDRQTCGIGDGGSIECWGAGPLSAPGEFASVSVGGLETCAVRADGAGVCWLHGGDVFAGQRGYVLTDAALDQPVELFPWPGGGLAVAERRGVVSVYAADEASRTVLDLTGRAVLLGGERGLLSAALDPEFAQRPYLYVYWQTETADGSEDEVSGRLSRFPIADGRADPAEELVVLEMRQRGHIHLGGAVRFGPDGMLYLSLGDRVHGIPSPLAPAYAQSLDTLRGKIVRIDVRDATAERPYRVPDDNPFVGTPDARPEIWAYGLRNPWRMHFGGDGRLWVGDAGSDHVEEVSIAERGSNLGWPALEGRRCFQPHRCDVPDNATPPVMTYGHTSGKCAVIGGVTLPGPDGRYVFGDYCSGQAWVLEDGGERGWWMQEIAHLPWPVSSFGYGHDGEVYALTFDGPVVRLSP